MAINSRKVAMVGCGFVGSASAFALMQSKLFSEMVLIDADQNRAEGEALDISHGMAFASPMKIYAGTYDDVSDAAGYPANRVIGSGTVLDTGRFRYELGEHLGVDSRSVHAYIIGEHGDSELAAWSDARVGGLKISDFCELRGHFNHEDSMTRIFDHVKNSAYEIISKKHATYYGIAMAVVRICSAIVRDEKSIMPVSSLMTGEYGLYDVVLSIPAVVDANGIETVVPIELSETELLALKKSADILKDILKDNV